MNAVAAALTASVAIPSSICIFPSVIYMDKLSDGAARANAPDYFSKSAGAAICHSSLSTDCMTIDSAVDLLMWICDALSECAYALASMLYASASVNAGRGVG